MQFSIDKNEQRAAHVSTRPLLVWTICLYSFICVPIQIVGCAALPFCLSVLHAHVQSNIARIDSISNHTVDPVIHDRLLKIRDKARTTEGRIDLTFSFVPGFIFAGEAKAFINLAAAIYLFRLRRVALPLFIAGSLIKMAYEIYFYLSGGMKIFSIHRVFDPHLTVAVGWAISLLIILSTWHLSRKGVLQ